MDTMQILLLINNVLCLLIVFDMIFISKKKPERIIAWTIFLLIPFVGLFFYILVGAGLSWFSKGLIKRLRISSDEYNAHIKKQIEVIKNSNESKEYPQEVKDLILLNLSNSNSVLTNNNDFKYFYDGESAVSSLIEDIKKARSTINLEFFIFANDKIGKQIKNLLIEKARQGVEIRLMYDAIGSLKTSTVNFRKLKKAGGKVSVFFPPFLNIKILNFNANYRNHRKICVIDGRIGYTGGFNIREDHLGHVKKLAPWRDTTVRVVGNTVHSLQNIFLLDWRFATKDITKPEKYFSEKFFPPVIENVGNVLMQVVASGPDNDKENIKECMIRMIVSAKKRIRIQTPYFIPDDTYMGALKLALLSGVEVELMMPTKVDHWHVHFAGYSYIDELLKFGLKVYFIKGFIHSKVLLVDDEIITVGSCNVDIRSFALNFEANIVVYNKEKALEYSKQFDKDIKNSSVYTNETRKKKNIFVKFLISFCRLFSAIL